jgi:predicted metal-dependent enzyme (double-stranded beta helix superfamily)
MSQTLGKPSFSLFRGKETPVTGLDLNALIAAVDERVRSSQTERGRVMGTRAILVDALRREDFLLDCVECILVTMSRLLAGWANPPLHANLELDYAIRLLYWPPHYENNPHQHNSWTVTGVLHNQIRVTTYDLCPGASPVGLSVAKSFECAAGEVGSILSPCIHSVSNPTPSVSVTLHVFSGLAANSGVSEGDEESDPKRTVWYPSPLKGRFHRDVVPRALTANLAILSRITGRRSTALLEKVFDLGDTRIKLASVKALCGRDVASAACRLAQLSELCPEPDRSRLSDLSHKLASTVDGG